MADKVDSIDTEKKVEGFITRHRPLFLGLLITLVVGILALITIIAIHEQSTKKDLAAISTTEFALTKALPDGYTQLDVASRQETALAELEKYINKSGIVGVRANMLYADIAYQNADYANALDHYVSAATLSKKNYTAPLCWFNAGVCAEEIGNVADALNYYQSAVDYSGEFLLVSHALFSIGRIKDASGDCTGAAEAYQKLVDGYEGTTWAKLAQSRLIDLKADGLIE